MSKTLVEQYVEDFDHMRLFQQERSIYEVTAMLEALMAEQGVSRAGLAKLLGRSKGWVTQLLDGEANKTIRTVADVCAVLGQEYCSFHRPIRVGRKGKPAPAPEQPPATTSEAGEARSVIQLYSRGGVSRVGRSSSVAAPTAARAEVVL